VAEAGFSSSDGNYSEMVFSLNTLVREFWYMPSAELTYFANQKAGTTSIKRSLWQHHNQITNQTYGKDEETAAIIARPRSVFPGYESVAKNGLAAFRQSIFFSCVRNPYVRLLSAYLDKIGRGKDDMVWREFCATYALNATRPLAFRDFVAIITRALPESVDVHFCPQHLNLLIPYVPYHHIFHLENTAPLQAFFSDRDVDYSVHDRHSTHSSTRLNEYYDAETAELVANWYRADFNYFGYATDIAILDPIADIDLARLSGDFLFQWMEVVAMPDKLERMNEIWLNYPDRPYFVDMLFYQILRTRNWDAAVEVAKMMAKKEPRNWKYLYNIWTDCKNRGDGKAEAYFENLIRECLPGHERMLKLDLVTMPNNELKY
jgi:hypothetical protein